MYRGGPGLSQEDPGSLIYFPITVGLHCTLFLARLGSGPGLVISVMTRAHVLNEDPGYPVSMDLGLEPLTYPTPKHLEKQGQMLIICKIG